MTGSVSNTTDICRCSARIMTISTTCGTALACDVTRCTSCGGYLPLGSFANTSQYKPALRLNRKGRRAEASKRRCAAK